MAKQRYPVGIDLGTTFSALAYVDEHNRLHAVRLEDDEFTLASAIYFRSLNEIVVGNNALHYSMIYPERVARAFKPHMADPDYEFVCDGKSFRPEALSAMILKKLVSLASVQLGPIEEVVISVPFVFDEARRRATQDAARIAGLRVLDLVDEPVAAALAYGHTLLQGEGLMGSAELDELFGDATILVYDLGGGTFDVTLMRLGTDGTFEVLATEGDERLGGELWDNEIQELLIALYQKHTGADPRGDPALMQELRLQAVEAKKTLSERPRTEVTVHYNGADYYLLLTKGDFERTTQHLVERTSKTVTHMLKSKGMSWSHIDRILVVGGASRMPMIPKMLERVTNRNLDMSLSPDVAIAKGAALYAALRTGGREIPIKEVITVNSHSLGLKIRDGKTMEVRNDILLKANEPTLKEAFRRYRVSAGGDGVTLSILLGDFENPDECALLGQGRIIDVPDNPAPNDVVEVKFFFLRSGMLQVNAVYRCSDGTPPRDVTFELSVAGTMTEDHVNDVTATLRGISFTD